MKGTEKGKLFDWQFAIKDILTLHTAYILIKNVSGTGPAAPTALPPDS